MRLSVLRRLAAARVALVSFFAVEIAAIPLLLFWGRHWWFWADDWDFLATRTGGNLGDLFRAHYQHWTTLPVIAYRLLWTAVGLRSYAPYQLLVIGAHLAAAALLRAVMRRAGVRPWVATLVAAVFVFFGAGAENILIAFQITFVGALVFGLAQLLLADHDGAVDRRDALALLAGLASLMCSGVGIAMAIIVGIAMLLRRGWRIALLHTAPLAVAYGIWSIVSPEGSSAGAYKSQSPVQVVKFVALGLGSAFGRLAQVPGLGVVVAVLLIVGGVLAWSARGRGALRGELAVPVALLAGALVFLVVTGAVRSGQPGPLASAVGTGPERARQSRYVYLVLALGLPALALAADAVMRRWRRLALPVIVLLLAGVPGNVHRLATYTNVSALDRKEFETKVLEAPRLPLAARLPRRFAPAPPTGFAGLTLGWLVDSYPSGRIPAPKHVSAEDAATQTLAIALKPGKFPVGKGCRTLHGPADFVVDDGGRISVRSGLATITYLPPSGGASRTQAFFPATMRSFLDGLRLRVTPLADAPAKVCLVNRPRGS
jgi:hypothetical protein